MVTCFLVYRKKGMKPNGATTWLKKLLHQLRVKANILDLQESCMETLALIQGTCIC